MKTAIAPIKNIARLAELGTSLQSRASMLPGIAVAYGESGIGKSTGLTWLSTTKLNACYVRALQLWSPSTMLQAIAEELAVRPAHTLTATIKRIVAELARTQRPLIVDEADYVVDQTRLLNTLRDLHDLSTMPLILVGMADFVRKLRTRGEQRQFAGRVALEMEFMPLDFPDVAVLAQALAEVEIAEDLLKLLHEKSQGITRLACVGIGRIETFAKTTGLSRVGAAQWANRSLNLYGQDKRAA
jgi:DNA transposition AAA+ family ATPase